MALNKMRPIDDPFAMEVLDYEDSYDQLASQNPWHCFIQLYRKHSCRQAEGFLEVAVHSPRHAYPWQRPVPWNTVPMDMAAIKIQLLCRLMQARYAMFADAWRELQLGLWVTFNESCNFSRQDGVRVRAKAKPKAKAQALPKALAKALAKDLGTARIKALRTATAKAKDKAKATTIPQVTAQPHGDAVAHAFCIEPHSSSRMSNSSCSVCPLAGPQEQAHAMAVLPEPDSLVMKSTSQTSSSHSSRFHQSLSA